MPHRVIGAAREDYLCRGLLPDNDAFDFLSDRLLQVKNELHVSPSTARRVSEEYEEQITEGLQQSCEEVTYMIPTMVKELPTGDESGEYYGIHVSGEHIHLVYTQLSNTPHDVALVQTSSTFINTALRTCSAQEFFPFLAEKLHLFSKSIGRDLKEIKDNIMCGLAFSFPCIHESLQSGDLIKWTKGFDIDGVVGSDPSEQLNAALKLKGLKAVVIILCNDSVASLCATRYSHGPQADIALAIDTGSNASYVEKEENILGVQQDGGESKVGTMVINTEWPDFRSRCLKLLVEDSQLDEVSESPGNRSFEKLTAGLYLGDIARRAFLSYLLDTCPGDLGVEQLIAMAEDTSEELDTVARHMQSLYKASAGKSTLRMRIQAKEISVLVLQRSAKLVAAASLGIIQHKENTPSSLASDAGVFLGVSGKLFYTSALYRSTLRNALKRVSDLTGEIVDSVQLYEVIGGASFGAAALAAAAIRQAGVIQ